MRIVIIDDELLIVKTMTTFLTGAGHDVAGVAGDLGRGLPLVATAEFDLAIVDLNLNGVSAEPLVNKLLERKIPFLLMSGYSDKQRPVWGQDAPFLPKPFAPDQLLKAVARV